MSVAVPAGIASDGIGTVGRFKRPGGHGYVTWTAFAESCVIRRPFNMLPEIVSLAG